MVYLWYTVAMHAEIQPSYSFGLWLRQRRRALDLTQAQLADQIGCALITLKKIESDERRPSVQMAERLAMCLHIGPAFWPQFVRIARGELAADRLPIASLDDSLGSANAPSYDLPFPPTPILGRTHDITMTAALLQGQTRLLTIVGPPGVGKSRLALELAHKLASGWTHGCCFVALASIESHQHVASAILQALSVPEHNGLAADVLLQRVLRTRRMLLLIDNFEHVLDAALLLADLLASCPQLHILVTSRVVLNLRWEHVYNLAPLEQIAAIDLFVMHYKRHHAQTYITEDDQADIGAIVNQLDRLPLAIEMASAWLSILHIAELRTQLTKAASLHTMIGTYSARDLPAHQHTLRDTIAWSYRLLGEQERTSFRKLGIFRGGWSLESYLALAGGQQILATLQRQSLIIVSEAEPLRYSMLEMLREFALDMLCDANEELLCRGQHAMYFLDMAERIASDLSGPNQIEAMQHLERDHDNLRTALSWFHDHDPHIFIRLAMALALFWKRKGHLSEGCSWLNQALAFAEGLHAQQHAMLHFLLADLYAGTGNDALSAAHYRYCLLSAENLGDQSLAALARCNLVYELDTVTESIRVLEQSIDLFRKLGDKPRIARGIHELIRLYLNVSGMNTSFQDSIDEYIDELQQLLRESGDLTKRSTFLIQQGVLATRHSRYAEACALLEESVSLFRRLSNPSELGWALRGLGIARAFLDQQFEAELALSESLRIFRKIGADVGIIWNCYELGRIFARQNMDEQAEQFLNESLATGIQVGEATGIACAHLWLGVLALKHNALEKARIHLRESIYTFYTTANQNGVIEALPHIAIFTTHTACSSQAAILLTAFTTLRTALKLPAPPSEWNEFHAISAQVYQPLDENKRMHAYTAGAALSLDQAYTTAMAILDQG